MAPFFGAYAAGYETADKLAQEGFSKEAQRIGASITTKVHLVAGPAIKVAGHVAKPSIKALNAKVQQQFGTDLSSLATEEAEALVEYLAEQGIMLTLDGVVKEITTTETDDKDDDK